MAATPPPYAPNTVNQTVDFGGYNWKGQPGGSWVQQGTTGGAGNGSGGGGSASVDTSAITDALKNAATNQTDFLARFRAAISGTPATDTTAATPGMAERIQTELGIPALSKAAQDMATNITNMPTTQLAANRYFDTNANQLQRIINQKQSELGPAATGISNALAAVTPLATQQMQNELLPWTTEAGMVSDTAAREVSGYTSIMQAQLDTLLEKMREGSALTLQESSQAADLAAKEQAYTEAAKANTQIVEVGGRKLLINSATGQTIQDLGSSSSGTGGGNPSTYLTQPTPTVSLDTIFGKTPTSSATLK